MRKKGKENFDMKAPKFTIKFRFMALTMLAPLVILTGAAFAESNNARISTIASTVPENGDINP